MREAARIDNLPWMYRFHFAPRTFSQDLVGQTHLSGSVYFRVNKINGRMGGRGSATTQFQKLHAEIRSFLPQPHPLSTPPTHPPSTSAPSAPPFGGACRKTGSTGSMFRCAGHSERGQWIHLAVDDYPLRIGVQPTVHSSRRNVCIYRSEGARSPMKAFRGGGFRLEASNRSVSIHRR